ncbi:Crp/Fnr family transcriptional regulator [Dawidia soli]|uniref:Crp/Fnr family transcriptional regulator n=1 Tax=Dawidia soli TaxID=2782352 RepID=A0AAP2GE46_9BACT|nr:Crp/Fnr family transcriptional regulator [Dawidia soli]MBT1687994.1 Crp/Fnr family transcriptional regulator [Dawidia soli]
MRNELTAFLQLFTDIPADDQALIEAAFTPKTFAEGEILFEGGHVCREMFFIRRGVSKIVVTNEKGTRVIHYFLRQNQFCTILESFLHESVAEEDIVAACPCEVFSISKAALLALYDKISYLEQLIDQIRQHALLDKIRIRNTYLGHDAQTRYKLFLMQQSDIALQVPLSDVASYLEITQQSLSRIRKNLR